ncbi:hypothetical protein NQ317_014579 [Molorchus minor]|uniref:Uncharacterized protein n=1 Tax=Molorchus minor TaxID=1323400 RepID=A0ABQ9JTD4_9CUCU|nr:hypothetical protein NQ317_014579 [Molorchus minor]
MDQDYERAKSLWDLYLKADVLLLCDVFENFTKISLEKYKLDPAHLYTAPGIRGVIIQCFERKHIANNQFLPNYNPASEPTLFNYISRCHKLLSQEIHNLDITSISDNNNEVDIHYPQKLHDSHSDLPFLMSFIIGL